MFGVQVQHRRNEDIHQHPDQEFHLRTITEHRDPKTKLHSNSTIYQGQMGVGNATSSCIAVFAEQLKYLRLDLPNASVRSTHMTVICIPSIRLLRHYH